MTNFFFIFLENEDDPPAKNRKQAKKHPLLESCRCKKRMLKELFGSGKKEVTHCLLVAGLQPPKSMGLPACRSN